MILRYLINNNILLFKVTTKYHSAQAEEPVDSFIDNLAEGQETVFRLTSDSLQTDSSVALLRAQQRTAAITNA